MQFLDLGAVHAPIVEEINQTVLEVVASGKYILGPYVDKFEKEVAAYLGVKHAVGVNSGTDALIIALRAHGIGIGDEVICPSWTFFATSESIAQVGAIPVFVDIDLESFNVDPEAVQKAISSKTKAIMPVHLYGRPAPMKELTALAKAHGFPVIEDTAQGFGGVVEGHKAGTIGTGAFSFFPSKNLGALGDGGLVTTNDDELADKMIKLRQHGGRQKYRNEILGYNSRLDAVQAAVLSVKLPHVDRWNEGRRQVATMYGTLFNGTQVVAPQVSPGHVFHQYTVLLPTGTRDRVESTLAGQGIPTMVYYPIPNHKLPVFETREHIRSGSLPVTMEAAGRAISLPIWPGMEKDKIEQVATALLAALR